MQESFIKKFKKNLYHFLLKTNFMFLSDYAFSKIVKRNLRSILIDIGSTCNALCPYCPRYNLGENVKKINGIMSLEVFNTIYSQLLKMPYITQVKLYAFGEPLLNVNAGDFIKRLKQINKTIMLSTNTTNLEKFTNELMLLDIIQFSIEGWDKESYEKTRKNLNFEQTVKRLIDFDKEIKKRREQGLHTPLRIIHCLYTKSTDIEKFIEMWSKYVDRIKFSIMGPYIKWNDEKTKTFPYYTDEMKKDCFSFVIPQNIKSCNYIVNSISVNSNGKVVLCCCDFSQHLDLGDYKNLKKAFKSKIFKDTLKNMYLGKENICQGCRNFYSVDKEEVYKYLPIIKNFEKTKINDCELVFDV